MERPITSSGQLISSSRPRAAQKPTTASSTPLTKPSATAVCTVSCTPFSSRAPKHRAATTLAPSESPTNRLTSRLINAPLEPTAASAVLPAKRPTTTTSAALNSNCRMLDAASGTENKMIFCSMGPLVRSAERLVVAMSYLPPIVRSRFYKRCTPLERSFCSHTALLSLAIHQGLLRKIALSAGKNSRRSAHPAYENSF